MTDLKEMIEQHVPAKWAKPLSTHKITFDSQTSQFEAIYYWFLDFIQDAGWEVQKVTDNFMSSPGSGHFADMGQRATRMQEEGMKILGAVNQVIKSILNLIYDLKEFEQRLTHYKDAKSDDKKRKKDGLLALKQIWLDNVDIKRGRGSIHQLATVDMNFATVREGFMMADNVEELEALGDERGGDLFNEQVIRLLKPRIMEFVTWVDLSYQELTKRFTIEKNYLKSQIQTVQLYSSWLRPYLKAAEELRQKGFEGNAALVSAFSTSMFELTLFCKKKAKVPEKFEGYNLKRNYYSVMMINLTYRGHVGRRVTQQGDFDFAAGGRVDMELDSYTLNSEEIGLAEKELKKSEVMENTDALGMMDKELLEVLQQDLDHFLKEKDDLREQEQEKKRSEADVNPFVELFRFFFSKKKDTKKKDGEIETAKDITPDNFVEKSVRADAAQTAAAFLYTVYDIYKKAHGMASSPAEFNNITNKQRIEEEGPTWTDVVKGKR